MSERGIGKEGGLLQIFSRVYALLTSGERKRALLMLGTVLVNSAVEVFGLAAVIPVIGLALEPEVIHRYDFMQYLFESARVVGVTTEKGFLIFMSVLLVFVFLFKALFGLLLTLFQTRFSFAVAHRLSGVMWSYHFSQNLEQLRGTNSGQILSEINGWPKAFANVFMVGSLRLITECFVVAVICLGLLAYEPVVLVAVASLIGLGTLLVRRVTDNRLRIYGHIQKERGPQTNGMVTNAVRGFLEVITFRAVEPVRNEYMRTTKLLFRVASNSAVINSLPAKTYEVLAVGGVSGAIVISLVRGTGGEHFFELLTLMAVSAYRVMPTMSRITGMMMMMRREQYVLEAMEKGIEAEVAATTQVELEEVRLKSCPTISLKGITLGYTSLPKPVLTGLSHFFEPGRIHAIVGASGSGKSTLVNAILGIHPIDEGEISISDGQREWVLGETCSRDSWLHYLGYLSQQPFFFSGSLRDNLTFRAPGREVKESLVNDLIQQLGLKSCLGESPLDFMLNEAGSNLSGGQQQRLALLRSLQISNDVLLLDEATSALDENSRDAVFELLRHQALSGKNVIVITHDISLAENCDKILNLDIL